MLKFRSSSTDEHVHVEIITVREIRWTSNTKIKRSDIIALMNP